MSSHPKSEWTQKGHHIAKNMYTLHACSHLIKNHLNYDSHVRHHRKESNSCALETKIVTKIL